MKEFMEEAKDIRFITVDNLFERKEEIRRIYQEKPLEFKEIYKWYFYFQLCLLKNPLKSLLWDYLNSEEDNLSLESELYREYRLFCEKREKLFQPQN